mgnify:CR=1 FL=1
MHPAGVVILFFAAAHATRSTCADSDTAVRLLAVACVVHAITVLKPAYGNYLAWAVAIPPVILALVGNIYETAMASIEGPF